MGEKLRSLQSLSRSCVILERERGPFLIRSGEGERGGKPRGMKGREPSGGTDVKMRHPPLECSAGLKLQALRTIVGRKTLRKSPLAKPGRTHLKKLRESHSGELGTARQPNRTPATIRAGRGLGWVVNRREIRNTLLACLKGHTDGLM